MRGCDVKEQYLKPSYNELVIVLFAILDVKEQYLKPSYNIGERL